MLDDGLTRQLFESLSEMIEIADSLSHYVRKEGHDVKVAGAQPILYQAKLVLEKARSAGLSLPGEDRKSFYWHFRFFLHDCKGSLLAILAVFLALAIGMGWMLLVK